MQEESSAKYYVLRAVTGKETKVKEYIEVECEHDKDFAKHIHNILVPMETVVSVRGGKKISREKPYYSGYVFVQADLLGEVTHKLRYTPNVLGFLGGNTDPVPLRDEEVKRMLNVADDLSEQPDDLDLSFEVGEKVKLTFDPFTGFYGEVIEVYPDKQKLKILVKVFGTGTPMEVSYMQVEKE